MTLAIQALARQEHLTEAGIDSFIETYDFPLQEGNTNTFIFRGRVDAVHLKHWVYGLESSQPFTQLEGTDLWYLVIDLPEKSRIEYKFDLVADGKHRWVHDPFNPHIARDPFGFNSVLLTQGYETPEWSFEDPETLPGRLLKRRLQSAAFGGTREFFIYLPARFRPTRQYPLLMVHDGTDYLRYAALETILNNLIHRGEVAPLIAVLTRPVDRLREYAADPRHAAHMVEELLPYMEDHYPLQTRAEHRGLMGASFGAVASLYTAWKHQGTFGRLLLQSGSFAFTDIGKHNRGPAFDPVVPFVNAFRENPGNPAQRLYLSCGTYESLIYENRSMVPLLQSENLMVKYTEARDGHNWENWRDRLREALSWLFPGPLWMVYE